jgi:hypothetical protein
VAVSNITDEGFELQTPWELGPAETIQKVEQAYAFNVIILLQAVNRSMSERIEIPFASSSRSRIPNKNESLVSPSWTLPTG